MKTPIAAPLLAFTLAAGAAWPALSLPGADATDISATQLGAPERFMLFPSPDGRQWAYAGGAAGGMGTRQIYICDRYGENARAITSDETLKVPGPWSPDGAKLLYIEAELHETGRSLRQRLVCINTDGTGKRVLSPTNVFLYLPVWGPDGRIIVFGSPKGLGLIPAAGGEVRAMFPEDDDHFLQRCFPLAWLSKPPAELAHKAHGWAECILYVTYAEKTELGRKAELHLVRCNSTQRLKLGELVCLVPQVSRDCSVMAYFDWAGDLYVCSPWNLKPKKVGKCNGLMGLTPEGNTLLYAKSGTQLHFMRIPHH